MSKSRRTFSKDFKSKVVLEALKEKDSLEALSKKHDLLPGQISTWKAEAIKNIAVVFAKEKTTTPKNETPSDVLYARIGQLTLEVDFLKKKLK